MPSRKCIRAIKTITIALVLLCVGSLSTAWAQTGTHFARQALSDKQYTITIDSSVTLINRDNFDTPTFLLGGDLETIELTLLETRLRATLDVLDGVSLQLELPLLFKKRSLQLRSRLLQLRLRLLQLYLRLLQLRLHLHVLSLLQLQQE